MNKPFKIVFLILISSFFEINALSQYYVKIKADSIGFEIDSVILAVDSLPGIISWEISKDSLTWEPLNESNDTLPIRISEEAYYRAVYYEGTCYPVSSDVTLVSFKSIEVTGNSVIIDSTGGVYYLPSGIKLIVPPGAVEENVAVSFDLLDSINADLKIPFDGDTGKVFCTGIYCEPPGISFLKPVRFNIPAPNYQHNDLPYVYLYDSNSELWEKHPGDLTCSENLHFIEFTTDKLVSARVHLYKDLFVLNNNKSGNISKQDITQDCKEGFIHVESEAYDYTGQQGSKECYVNSDKTTVAFLDCPGKLVGKAEIQEIGKDCKPVLKHSMDKNCLNIGESTTVTVTVTIGGKVLKDQEIQFYNLPSGLAINKTSDKTNENGQAQFIITCLIENFYGTIQYKANYNYYLEVMAVSEGSTVENIKNYPQTGDVFNEFQLKTCQILTSITLFQPPSGFLDTGDVYTISKNCLDQFGKSMACDTKYAVGEYPEGNIGVVSIAATGEVTALKPGFVKIKAYSGNIESNSIGLSVSYQGDVTMSKTINWNDFTSGCCCPMDMEQNDLKNCWIMNYSGSMHVKFYLGWDESRFAQATFEGCETISYTINEPSLCRSDTFYNYIYTFEEGKTHQTTGDILLGTPFYIGFMISQAPSEDENCENIDFLKVVDWPMTVFGTLTSPSTITITSVSWVPDGCVPKVHDGTGVLK